MRSVYDINHLVQEAQCRWLKPAEVYFILENHERFQITEKAPQKPTSGSLFLFNKNVLRFFRKDGHNWRKKKDGKSVGEAHERLKVNNVEALNCYYAHGEDNPNFQRRSYWILDPAHEHIVLVHYREITAQGNSNAGSILDFSPSPSYTISQTVNNIAIQNQGTSSLSDLHGSNQSMSSPGPGEVSSQAAAQRQMMDHLNSELSENFRTLPKVEVSQALRRIEEQLSLDDDSFIGLVPFDNQQQVVGETPVFGYAEGTTMQQNLCYGEDDVAASSSTDLAALQEIGPLLFPRENEKFKSPAYSEITAAATIILDHHSTQLVPGQIQMPLESDSCLTRAPEHKFRIKEILADWGLKPEKMIPTMMPEAFMQFGSIFATLITLWAFYHQFLPHTLQSLVESGTIRYFKKLADYFSPYLDITFDEYSGGFFDDRSEVYTTVQTYVSERSPAMARRMKANRLQGKSLMLSMAEYEEVSEEYEGVKVWWTYNRNFPKNSTISFYPGEEEKRFYQLTFHRRHRELITTSYLNHVLEEGKAITVRKRQRKLYTNTHEAEWIGYKRSMWSHIAFKHPGRFGTLAMEPERKQRIVDDLLRFRDAKDYYEKVGKPWKRGYLLHGPPGTGKSTMVAAIANLLEYDIYDLELAAVKDNIMLRKLLIETSNKSIILIEDIDCSLDLTGKRDKKEEEEKSKDEKDPIKKALLGEKKKGSEVTLSGLLNFIDGIWSACGDERIILFTTNHIDKLDPALIRTGRMDMHIELSYCCFEAFKVLVKNYLDLDGHPLFGEIERLLKETEMTPADVAECLMPKSSKVDIDECMRNLVAALEKAKVDAEERRRKEEEAKAKEKEDAEKKAVEEKTKVKDKDAKEEDVKVEEKKL